MLVPKVASASLAMEVPVDVVSIAPEDPAFRVLFACVLPAALTKPFPFRLSAMEVGVCEDVADCSVDSVAEAAIEDTVE